MISHSLPLRALLFILLSALGLGLSAHARKQKTDEIHIEEMVPTQLTYGSLETDLKTERIASLPKKERNQYLWEERPQVVRAPDGKYYVIDGHHIILSAKKAGMETLDADIIEDQQIKNAKTMKEFWTHMQKRGWVYLFDGEGKPIKVSQLPKDFDSMVADFGRDAAWFLRKAGVFEKDSSEPFQEMEWGKLIVLKFHEKGLPIPKKLTLAKMFELMPTLIEIAQSKEAQNLRGAKNCNFYTAALKKFLKSDFGR